MLRRGKKGVFLHIIHMIHLRIPMNFENQIHVQAGVV
jgi:hypothetical protein